MRAPNTSGQGRRALERLVTHVGEHTLYGDAALFPYKKPVKLVDDCEACGESYRAARAALDFPKDTRPEHCSVGSRIRTARRQTRMSQGELGSKIGPPRSHAAISDIERDVTSLTVRDLLEIAAVLGVSAEWLLIDGRLD